MNDEEIFEKVYKVGVAIVGFPTFIGLWLYAFSEWGFLIGLAIGWLPALIGAGIVATLWPLIVIVAIIGFIYLS